MALEDKLPKFVGRNSQDELGEQVDMIKTNLSILTSFAIRQQRIEATTIEEYYEDYAGFRYQRFPGRITQAVGGTMTVKSGFMLGAKRLRAEGQDDWFAQIFVPDDSMPVESGPLLNRYIMHLLLVKNTNPIPEKVITVDCSDGIDSEGPRIGFWNPHGLTNNTVFLDSFEIADSYPMRVVEQVSDQLKREADALLVLALDGITA